MRPGFQKIGRAMKTTKSEWRRELLAARSAIPSGVRQGHVRTITERARGLQCLVGAATVLGYDPIGAEVDPSGVMTWATQNGASVLTPTKSVDEGVVWKKWPSSSGSMESIRAMEALRSPIVVLAPGVGYDERGTRLGRGQGFYDRVLAFLKARHSTCIVALAFECQLVSTLPVDPWDVSVHVIVTERRVLDFEARAVVAEGGRTS